MRTKCAISYAASEIALLRCCVFADYRLRKNAIVCLRWHGTGLNSTDAYVLSLLDSLRIQTSDFHLKTEILKSKATLKSFDKQYIKSIWTTTCNEYDILVASTYRKCHRCAMFCRRLRNLGKYQRNKVQYSELFFRECGLPGLRTILDCVLSRCVFADYLIRDCALCQCGSRHVFSISWTFFFRLRNSANSDAEYEIAHFVRIVYV